MKVETHRIETAHRVGICKIRKRRSHVVIRLRFSHYGELGDEADLATWILPIAERIRKGKRKIVIDNPLGRDASFVLGLGKLELCLFLIATSPTDHENADRAKCR